MSVIEERAFTFLSFTDRLVHISLAKKGDSITQFNTTFAQDRVLLYIPKNVALDETIQIVATLQANVDMMSNRRLLIKLGENSSASLLLCDHSSLQKQTLSTQVTEIFIGQGTSLNLYEIEETALSKTRLGHLFVRLKRDSRFNHCNITLTNGFTRNYVEAQLNGEGAETCVNGLAIDDKEQHIRCINTCQDLPRRLYDAPGT